MVEHWPHHPKVVALSQATVAITMRKIGKTNVFVFVTEPKEKLAV